MSNEEVLAIGGEQVPYFRTREFSDLMLENERLMKEFVNASEEIKAVFITGSGTASMEAVVMNVFTSEDRLLVIDGGSFGHRFTQLCDIHKIPYTAIRPRRGHVVTPDMLKKYEGMGFTGLLVNIHETSTGVHYDPQFLGDFCHRNGMLFVIDAISSFLADPLDMQECHVDVIITGSQKVLACAPDIHNSVGKESSRKGRSFGNQDNVLRPEGCPQECRERPDALYTGCRNPPSDKRPSTPDQKRRRGSFRDCQDKGTGGRFQVKDKRHALRDCLGINVKRPYTPASHNSLGLRDFPQIKG